MSKESLEKLNQTLLEHFEETGVENAIYYERQLVIKYTDLDAVKFTSLNNLNNKRL